MAGEPMRVQRVAPLEAGDESWTVLGDDWCQVVPVEQFLSHLSDQGRSPNTVKAYAHDLKDYFEYLTGRGLAWDRLRYDELAAFKPWLRLPAAARRGEISALPVTTSASTESTINRKLSAVTSFYEFHRRHGVEMALTIRDASRSVASTGTSFRPFLAHVKRSRPRRSDLRLRLRLRVRESVSRSWLYTQPDIRAAIDQLRHDNSRSTAHRCRASSAPPPLPWFAGSKPRTDATKTSAAKSPSYATWL